MITWRMATALLLAALSAPASAWWNEDWAFREKVTLNTGAAGVPTQEAAAEVPVLLRLHSGNYGFLDGKPDAGDLRVVAGDDRTPLKFHLESFDANDQLGLLWVRVPALAANNAAQPVYVYYGNQKAVAEGDSRSAYGPETLLVLHLGEKQGGPKDRSNYAHPVGESTAAPLAGGVIGGAASFNGSAQISVPAAPTLKSGPTGLTASLWIRVAEAGAGGPLLKFPADGSGLQVALAGGKLQAQAAGALAQGATDVAAGAWHHVAVVYGQKLTLYLDGKAEAEAAATPAALAGPLLIGGAGFKGDVDEVLLEGGSRSADWVHLLQAAGAAESKLAGYGEIEQSGGGKSYFKILLGAVTMDGWVVIGILMVMMVISFGVMVGKARFVIVADRANRAFLAQFEKNAELMLDPDQAPKETPRTMAASSLLRMWRVAVDEIGHRFETYERKGQARALGTPALNAIKASLDAVAVRENARLNAQMVLLTIAISGGPFLGLLGTVVGVMITFAAIAAAGDVNVNSIAPGIAAALVATVAGLGVAIPSLFGYNYLASRIKGISNDLAVFGDELVARLAERYGD